MRRTLADLDCGRVKAARYVLGRPLFWFHGVAAPCGFLFVPLLWESGAGLAGLAWAWVAAAIACLCLAERRAKAWGNHADECDATARRAIDEAKRALNARDARIAADVAEGNMRHAQALADQLRDRLTEEQHRSAARKRLLMAAQAGFEGLKESARKQADACELWVSRVGDDMADAGPGRNVVQWSGVCNAGDVQISKERWPAIIADQMGDKS